MGSCSSSDAEDAEEDASSQILERSNDVKVNAVISGLSGSRDDVHAKLFVADNNFALTRLLFLPARADTRPFHGSRILKSEGFLCSVQTRHLCLSLTPMATRS